MKPEKQLLKVLINLSTLALILFSQVGNAQEGGVDFDEIDKFLSKPANASDKIIFLDRYLKKWPNNDYLLGMRGYFLLEVDSVEAGEFFKKEILSQNNMGEYCAMASGAFFAGKGNYKKASEYLKYAQKLDKEVNNKWIFLELFHAEKDDDVAAKYLEKSLQIDPFFYYALLSKAYFVLDEVENCAEIINILDKVDLEQESVEVINHLGMAYYNCGNIEKSYGVFLQSVEVGKSGFAYNMLGNIAVSWNDLELAEKYYLENLKLNEHRDLALRALGWLYFRSGRYSVAETLFRELIVLEPTKESYEDVIMFYLKTNNFSKAREVIKERVVKHGNDSYSNAFLLIVDFFESKSDLEDLKQFCEGKNANFVSWFNNVLKELEIGRK